eukprot:3816056-Heterocapsa_arctica.AAC.1
METDGPVSPLPDDFNWSFLCCLPKKPAGETEQGKAYYIPSTTRPLSLVNTDNRLLCCAYRLLMEPMIGNLISHLQNGFISGRKILDNVLEIDAA